EVFGKKGDFDAGDIVDLCLEQKSTPYFIAGKLYRYLVTESAAPAQELLEPLAQEFRKSGYDTAAVVRTILRSNLFFSEHAYRSRIKPPVALAFGIIRPFRVLDEGDPA